MGNTIITPCFQPKNTSSVTVIFHGGATRILIGKHVAGEIMFEFPDSMVCHADSFFIGYSIPSLSINDELISGETYFVLPLDSFANKMLSVSSISGLGSGQNQPRGSGTAHFKQCPFEYVKGRDGKVLIKVVPDFIIRLISKGNENGMVENDDGKNSLCSTPELLKDYKQLVVSRDQLWSPKLDSISEFKIRFSPCKFLGLEWKQTEEGIQR